MRLSKEILLTAGLTVAALLGGVACSGEGVKAADESGIEVTPQNADARQTYLSDSALQEMRASVKQGKVTIADGLCLGYTTTRGYNIAINPSVVKIDNDHEFFELFGIAAGVPTESLADAVVLPGPYTYVQKDENGESISATSMGFQVDIFEFKPVHELEANITLAPNNLQPGLWMLQTSEDAPAMFSLNIGSRPADFEAECQRLLTLYF